MGSKLKEKGSTFYFIVVVFLFMNWQVTQEGEQKTGQLVCSAYICFPALPGCTQEIIRLFRFEGNILRQFYKNFNFLAPSTQ